MRAWIISARDKDDHRPKMMLHMPQAYSDPTLWKICEQRVVAFGRQGETTDLGQSNLNKILQRSNRLESDGDGRRSEEKQSWEHSALSTPSHPLLIGVSLL